MSYQQPPDDPYQQQTRPSFTPYQPSRPSYPPPQGQQPPRRQPQQPYYGPGDVQPAKHQRIQPLDQQGYPAQAPQHGHHAHRQVAGKRYALRGAESFWYVLGCIGFGAAYFSKLPAKKAACEVFSELQLDGQGPSHGYSLRGMESFWYVLMCIAFGGGYFAKVWAKKALWEMVGMVQAAPDGYAVAMSRALAGSAVPYPPAF